MHVIKTLRTPYLRIFVSKCFKIVSLAVKFLKKKKKKKILQGIPVKTLFEGWVTDGVAQC